MKYIRSRAWARLRRLVLGRAGGRCESCGKIPLVGFDGALQVHHITYERLGAEPLEDLVAVCAGCHLWAHGGGRASG